MRQSKKFRKSKEDDENLAYLATNVYKQKLQEEHDIAVSSDVIACVTPMEDKHLIIHFDKPYMQGWNSEMLKIIKLFQ